MNALLTLLANREKAMVIWLAVAVICFLFNKGIRRSLRELLSILFSPQILEVMSWMLIWVAAPQRYDSSSDCDTAFGFIMPGLPA